MPRQKSGTTSPQQLIPVETITDKIFLIRGQKVMLDRDLAELYGVSTKRLNEQVKRNRERFPEDFMFQLTQDEGNALLALRSHFATLKRGQHLKYAPYVFTEHGAFMAAALLQFAPAFKLSARSCNSGKCWQPIRTWPASSRTWSASMPPTTPESSRFFLSSRSS